jgi:hypothetical protein
MIISLKEKVIPAKVVKPSISHADMLNTIANSDTYDGFIGGVVITPKESEKFYKRMKDKHGKIRDFRFCDFFPTYPSLDGKKIAMRICLTCECRRRSWLHATPEIFSAFVKNFKPSCFKTKSEFQKVLVSEKWQKPVKDIV